MTSFPSTSPAARVAGGVARLVLFVLVSVVAGVVAAGALLPFVGGVGIATRTGVEDFEALPATFVTPPLPQRSVILAADGSRLATVYYQNRIEVPLADIAPVMRQAIVAIEDSRFYEHHGFDLRGFLRAAAGTSSGGQVQGGSTITQQYVKQVLVNAATTPEEAQAAQARTLSRKIKELRYALALEKQYSKDEILERYLNIAYFGAGAYGVEAAARRYFSTSAKDLTLEQAATLAGVVQQPTGYDPLRNPDASQRRRTMVLNRMADLGFITPAQATTAAAVPTKSFLKPKTVSNGCTSSSAPYFCDYVLHVIKNDPAFGDTPVAREALLRQGGLTIRTTLQPDVQADALKAVTDYIPTKDKSRKLAAISMVQPGTGKILAMAQNYKWGIKGRGRSTYNFNVGTAMGGSLGAQSGSTFKVFTLAAALEKGVSPYEKIESPQSRTFRGFKNCSSGVEYPPYHVNNSTGAGNFTMLQGTAYSINTYFMALEKRTGLCKPAEIAESMGLRQGDGDSLNRVPSFTLGTDNVTPLGIAEAYATFANHGEHCTSIAITRVTDRSGKDLKVPDADCTRVIPREVADSVTAILSQVIDGPLAGRTGAAMTLNRQAAGKTGTINNSAAVWFAGYTPDLAAAVWTGDPRGGYGHPMKNVTIKGRYYSQVFGSTLPGPIWKQAMSAALKGTPKTKFDLRTLDGLGTWTPPPPAPPKTDTNPKPNPSGSPGPGTGGGDDNGGGNTGGNPGGGTTASPGASPPAKPTTSP
jgi:membrane peptidoglycan carboxypeptidase